MTETSTLRGHKIERLNNEWVYSDTKELTSEKWEARSCGVCNQGFTDKGHDPCISNLPDVKNACCGHGDANDAYIQFDDEIIIRGNEAIKYIKSLEDESNKPDDRTVESPHSTWF